MNDRPNNPVTLDIHQILSVLPHRYPLVMVDRVTEIISGKSIRGASSVHDDIEPACELRRGLLADAHQSEGFGKRPPWRAARNDDRLGPVHLQHLRDEDAETPRADNRGAHAAFDGHLLRHPARSGGGFNEHRGQVIDRIRNRMKVG
jgi:hypothetical protein